MSHIVIQKKICLLGAFGIGKTSLIRRFVHDRFDDAYLTTVGVKVSRKLMPPVQNPEKKWIQHNFLIWDIEGIEKASEAQKKYITGASGALIVSDLTRRNTTEFLPGLIDTVRQVSANGRVVIVGNKSDLIESDVMEKELEVLKPIAGSNEISIQLTSAKTGHNVEAAFADLSRLMCR